jgi:transcriptional regulator with XRE-family HTH domain
MPASIPPNPAAFVARVRASTGLSQAGFAEKYGLSVATLRGWERGARKPDRAAVLLLILIESSPAIVERVIKRAMSIADPSIEEVAAIAALSTGAAPAIASAPIAAAPAIDALATFQQRAIALPAIHPEPPIGR